MEKLGDGSQEGRVWLPNTRKKGLRYEVYQHFGPVRVGDELIAVNGCRGSLQLPQATPFLSGTIVFSVHFC